MLQRKKNAFESVKSMTIAAMLTAMSIAIGMFCKSNFNYGPYGMFRITFENLPIIIGGILFGPIVGGTIGAASDIISYFFSGQAYPFNLIVTLGAMSVGMTSGLMSRYVVKKKGKAQIIVSGALAHVVGSMIIKPIGLYKAISWAVLLRIPIYMIIAPIEIAIICVLFSRKSFCRVVGYY